MTNLNQLHIFDTESNSFSPHMVQFMVERPAEAGGAEWTGSASEPGSTSGWMLA